MSQHLIVTDPRAFDAAADARLVDDPYPTSFGAYELLHAARVNLLNAATALRKAAADSTVRMGQLYALVGYTEVFFGENFCSGVPLGHLDADLRPVYGLAR